MDILSQDIMYLPGVGPQRKELLKKELEVSTWGGLLEYYPYKYVDRSRIYAISELTSDMPFVQIKGRILSFEEFEMGPRGTLHRRPRRDGPRMVLGCAIRLQEL